MFETKTNPDGSTYRSRQATYQPGDRGGVTPKKRDIVPKVRSNLGDKLDSPQNRDLYGALMGYFLREIEGHRENRVEQDLDHRCYDNDQWDARDLLTLKRRGQTPVTLNVTATTINWILGTELRSRVDFKVLARKKENSGEAGRKTEFLKYLGDINRAHFHRSRAFGDCVKGGIGWLEDGVQSDEDGEPVYSRYESWRNMFWDRASTELDLSDARYVIRTKWVDLDIVEGWFPKRAHVARLAAQHNSYLGAFDLALGDDVMDTAEREIADLTSTLSEFDYSRPRVRVIEVWFRKVTRGLLKMSGGQFAGEVYDPWSEGHAAEIASGEAQVIETTGMRMHCAIMTTAGLLSVTESPYRHNGFPFTPIWCYRRDSNNLPYGVIRGLRSIQNDINWRAAKALHILSSNKIVTEKGAVDDIDELLEEASHPDAVIELNAGYHGKFTMNADRELAPAHMEVMTRMIAMIEQVGGVTNENLGRQSNAKSGIAIERRQDQGALSTAIPFDHLRLAMQISGEKQISLIEQFFTKQKQFRITNARGKATYASINDPADPESMVAFSKADFVISEDAWQATVRAAQAEQLLALAREMAATAPQVVVVMLDLIIDSLDVPNREELVQRIRAATGQTDPDSDELSPEEQVRKDQEAAAADRAIRMEEAEIADKESSAAQKKAAADKTAADALLAQTKDVLEKVNTQMAAFNTALAAISARGAAPVADAILRESGFIGQSEKDEAAEIDAEAGELEQLAAEGAAMQEAAAGAAMPDDQPPAPPI